MNEASGCACQLGSKASRNMWVFLFFCEGHYWLFVIINQCKKQSPYFEQLYVCAYVCIYICSQPWNVFFCNYGTIHYNCYMEVVVLQFVYKQQLSKLDYIKVYLLLLQIVSKQICPIQTVWKLLLRNGFYSMHR